ncbi:MAG: hypothetical protein K9I94_00480 [Bacteroidales bacterium]|nr:hypothetical protein [Bacteroidales bacterium]
MKHVVTIISLFFLLGSLSAQDEPQMKQGKVSYITSQHVYVKFENTTGIDVGDTLFITEDGEKVPALKVNNRSSISCVCIPIIDRELKIDQKVFAEKRKSKPDKPSKEKKPDEAIAEMEKKPEEKKSDIQTEPEEIATDEEQEEGTPEQDVSGRITTASYSNFSNTLADNSQRMRYVVSFDAENINNSKLSAETYISFSHRNNEWSEIQDNLFNGLKLYNLDISYDFNANTSLLFGRKINRNLSSVGAIDGLQFEKQFGAFTTGVVAGSRPDWEDYSFNTSLFQAGAYVSHRHETDQGHMQSTLSFMEQRNSGNTDRRFVYFQHMNMLIDKLYFFGSGEVDLYKQNMDGSKESTFNLTHLYLMLRYRPFQKLRFSVSYSARDNIIYYETYKSILEQLLERETLQGYRFSVHYRPINKLSIGARAGYRYRPADERPSKNLYAWITYSRIPVVGVSATLYSTLMETSYISGSIYGARLNRDIIRGKLYGGLQYKYVDYSFVSNELKLLQNSAQLSLTWRIIKDFSFSLDTETTFEEDNTYNRVYLRLTKRF